MKKIILALLTIATYTTTQAQQPNVVMSDKTGWHKIGETTADFKTEVDEIMVVGADRFGYIKIAVTDASINLESFDIIFENGEKQNVVIGKVIKHPGETRTVQLNGGEREIKKIVYRYKTVPNNADKKAHIELWGMKTNPDKKTSSK